MYCVNCGIKLANTEEKCPLCSTLPGSYVREALEPGLYPKDHYPEKSVKKGALNGVILFLFIVPLLLIYFIDEHTNGVISWFWYAAGAVGLTYVVVALPLWFRRPNPVIFVPCDFAAAALYLLLIEYLTGGSWFLPFALPITAGIGVIVTAVVTLMRYVRRGALYIFGGAFIALGAHTVATELLLCATFGIEFIFWSVYPMIVLGALGGLLIYLAIDADARERMERRLFF